MELVEYSVTDWQTDTVTGGAHGAELELAERAHTLVVWQAGHPNLLSLTLLGTANARPFLDVAPGLLLCHGATVAPDTAVDGTPPDRLRYRIRGYRVGLLFRERAAHPWDQVVAPSSAARGTRFPVAGLERLDFATAFEGQRVFPLVSPKS